jgi:hypothetical protein
MSMRWADRFVMALLAIYVVRTRLGRLDGAGPMTVRIARRQFVAALGGAWRLGRSRRAQKSVVPVIGYNAGQSSRCSVRRLMTQQSRPSG